jgi:hypothetical protein
MMSRHLQGHFHCQKPRTHIRVMPRMPPAVHAEAGLLRP